MSKSAGKYRKRYVDHPKDGSKPTCIIHGPGNSPDEFKVLGDFGSKYATISPTKDCGNDPTRIKNISRHQENNAMVNSEFDEILLQ